MKTMAGMCPASRRSSANGQIDGRSCANTIWPCRFGCCAIFRAAFANPSSLDVAADRLASRWLPALRFFIAFGVAIECAFEISESNDESGPSVDEAKLEDIVLDERPRAVAERACHRYTLVREFRNAQ